jgi:hypothetical protein
MDAAAIEPHVVRLREGHAGWRRVDGPRLTPDDPFLVGLDEAHAAALVRSQWALRHADVDEAHAFYVGTEPPPFPPGEYTVDELAAKLADGDYGGAALDALAAAEVDGQDRTTALEAIDEAREEAND